MDKHEIIPRALGIAGQARTQSVAELWRFRSDQDLINRAGKLVVAKAISPFFPKTLNGYSLLSSGYEQVVYASDSQVRKILTTSITRDKREAIRNSAHTQALYDRIKSHMGRHLLDTYFEPVRLRNLTATAAVQPRLAAEFSYRNTEELVNGLGNEYEEDELANFCAAVNATYEDTSIYPDILGDHNIFLQPRVFRGERITLVDTLPVLPERQSRRLPGTFLTVGEAIVQKLLHMQTSIITAESRPAESREAILH